MLDLLYVQVVVAKTKHSLYSTKYTKIPNKTCADLKLTVIVNFNLEKLNATFPR